MTKNQFPPGWNEEKVARVIAHYETQSEEDAVAEDEIALKTSNQTLMEIPVELVPIIRELIAKYQT